MAPGVSEIRLPKLPLLGEETTRKLISKAQSGDTEAKERLVQHNLRLVMSVTTRFTGRGTDEEDLFQLGCLGLVRAIDRFNLEMGVQFSTYAVPLIMGEIRQYLRESGPIKISRTIRETAQQVAVAREKLLQDWGREPTISELQESTQLTREEISTALEAAQPVRYLQEVIGDEESDGITVADRVMEADPQELSWLEGRALHEVLNLLDPRLKRILEQRFFEEKTQTEVASEFGVSQVQISRLEKEALRRLRDILRE